MSHDIVIRAVREDELEAFAGVIRQSFTTVAADFRLTEQNCPTNGAFIRAKRLASDRNRGDLMAGLFEDGKPAGFAQLSQKDNGVFELGKLAVLPRCRHNGYGALLLNWAQSTAREREARKITIGIIEENTVLKSWYLAHGFVHTGTDVFPHLPFTVGYMELEL
jgi:ribosomal protein S18 acetylase RimI-like enzyme